MIVKGQMIDNRYKVMGTIGEGGMANVYLAFDTILGREVAVKVLRGDLADDEKFVRRFQREANSASSLRHPNIVEMYDVGEDNGNYFIVMEYVDGKTLKSLIKKRGALTLPETIDIMLQLTSGIACAHDSMIIHRDIKPQNVLILEDGRVKITDFGIAMALNSNELTQTNSVMGSVHYLPPEQANGSGATIKSDIYSLGILMYELLTGKLPFKGDSAVEIAIKQMKEEIPSIRDIRSEVPQSVENVVIKACAKNPKNRYDSVADMYDDLKTVLEPTRAYENKHTYPYSEHDLEDTKIMPTIKNVKETREGRNEELKEFENVKKKDKKLNKGLIIGGSICGVLIISIIAFLLFFNGKSTVVEVPDVVGMQEDKAVDKLEKAGFNVNVKEEANDEIEEGEVISVDPKGGNKVKKGAEVILYVSSGFDGIEVEDYIGENIETIKNELLDKEIQVIATPKKIDSENEDDIKENDIIEQSIEEGEKLKTGGTIELTYAVLIVTYPNFTEDYDEIQVQQFCDDNKLNCKIEKTPTTEHEAGTIYYQSRKEGDEVKEGASLTIKIAETQTYTLSFNTNGGSSVNKQTIKSGEKATKPQEKPSKKVDDVECAFTGWVTDGSICDDSQAPSQLFNFNTSITKDTTLYACYTGTGCN